MGVSFRRRQTEKVSCLAVQLIGQHCLKVGAGTFGDYRETRDDMGEALTDQVGTPRIGTPLAVGAEPFAEARARVLAGSAVCGRVEPGKPGKRIVGCCRRY